MMEWFYICVMRAMTTEAWQAYSKNSYQHWEGRRGGDQNWMSLFWDVIQVCFFSFHLVSDNHVWA